MNFLVSLLIIGVLFVIVVEAWEMIEESVRGSVKERVSKHVISICLAVIVTIILNGFIN